MKILTLHCDYIKFKPTKKALKSIKELKDKKEKEVKEPLVVLTAVEKGDLDVQIKELVAAVKKTAKEVRAKNIVLYPYAHLSSNLAPPDTAQSSLDKVEKLLSKDFKVTRAPFGYYKSFELKVKGHPLSELSKEFKAGETAAPIKEEKKTPKERKKGSEFAKFILVDIEGKEYEVIPKNVEKSPIWKKKGDSYSRLKQFVENEIGKKSGSGKMPAHIRYMRELELVDYCDVSEAGHYKWYPKGVLIKRLLLDYAKSLAEEWGAFEMTNPIIIKGSSNIVGQLMGEFHERDYKVDGGRGVGYLRYASDPLGFPFLQNVKFTHKQTPLKVYEEASSFRNEQEGEVSGLKRVRNFLMTDMHAACATEKEALKEFENICIKFGKLMDDIIASGRWVLGWEGTVDFYNQNKKWLIDISKKMKVPAFFKLSKEMSHYYAIKNEYQTILEDNSNIQVSTVQWDIKDGPRFNIGYIGKDSKKHPCPVIIHASSFGSIERTLCSILENIAIDEKDGKIPKFAYWLSPIQARVLPVSEKYLEKAKKIAEKLNGEKIRTDFDDRDLPIPKKVSDAEKEWVPYIIVIGEKELKSGKLAVRIRKTTKIQNLSEKEFVKLTQKEQANMPWRPLPVSMLLTKRPIFV